jgi:hypothetical protein
LLGGLSQTFSGTRLASLKTQGHRMSVQEATAEATFV